MSRSIPESDWKLFRQFRTLALERYCQRVLDEIAQIAADPTSSPHNRYLAICQVVQRRDRTVAENFNDPSRSKAIIQLRSISSLGLLTNQEIERFSPETRDSIKMAILRVSRDEGF
jgi:hypothetical protein